MKIGIYSPYLDTIGGGEKYMLSIAQILSEENNVDVLLDTYLQTLNIKEISGEISKILDLDLSKIKFVKAPLGKHSNILKRSAFLRNYDLIFCLTDGSIFYSTSKRSVLHIQSPVRISNTAIWRKLKISSWDLIIYNSEFTKENCEKYWPIKGEVIYPPVDIEKFKAREKKKQIVTVGRFFGYSKVKKHELMIDSFKNIIDSKKTSGWSFHLVGGMGEGDLDYVKGLKSKSEGYPIEFHANLPFEDLKKLYGESSIYWHASGFGETDPTKMEHFGITTVEAMASGCVPVVINLGGQKEIVEEGVNGFLWNSPDELEEKTLKLIDSSDKLKKISKNSTSSVGKFSLENFRKKIESLI